MTIIVPYALYKGCLRCYKIAGKEELICLGDEEYQKRLSRAVVSALSRVVVFNEQFQFSLLMDIR